MRIKTFGKFLEVNEVQPRKLRNEAVVIDAHNFFFLTYEESGLPYELGCESPRYASYLTHHLNKFKQANVQPYFLFKGGWENMEQKLESQKPPKAYPKRPLFTKNIIIEVLKNNSFQYVFCEYESKNDIIELAERLKCPIISFDVEFCFSGHPYISSLSLEYHESDNSIHCGVFLLRDFLKKHKLTEEKVATFIVLTDELIYPECFFSDFFKLILNWRAYGPYKRNLHLLEWLTKSDRIQILGTIFRFLSDEDKKTFLEKEIQARKFIGRHEFGGFGAECSLDSGAASVAYADPLWFAKGVASAHIDHEYVNLYRSKYFYGSKASADKEQDDAIVPSLEILKYALDLLTNFKNDGFKLIYDTEFGKRTMVVGDAYSIAKPAYEAEVCVFENGWDSIRDLGLFEHFLRSMLQLESLRRVEHVSERARLLLLALAYCSRRRPAAPVALPAVALLTHVVLDVVADNHNNNPPKRPFENKPILDSITDRSVVTVTDCAIAAAIMEGLTGDEKIDAKLLHPLVEYQQCMVQLSALNVLCGEEVPPPVWSRTYSGTLAYKLLRAAERAPDVVTFLDDLLSPAPTVYAYFRGLWEAYEDLLFVEAHEDL